MAYRAGDFVAFTWYVLVKWDAIPCTCRSLHNANCNLVLEPMSESDDRRSCDYAIHLPRKPRHQVPEYDVRQSSGHRSYSAVR